MSEKIYPKHIFPFPLDPFQLESIDALEQGHSLVVSAPTGSGKTLVAEYAIHRALNHRQKVFYTTPLKALSNQKFRDFNKQFGTGLVGLLTGDITFNRNAEILVMTTEIFRNMFYGTSATKDDPFKRVETVILDECHYINDAQRGTVWEESIIHCPLNIQIVALSATIANADQLADWIDRIHGPTTLIVSDYRPVALKFNFCSGKGLHPLAVTQSKKNSDFGGMNQKILRVHNKHNKTKVVHLEIPSIRFVLLQMAERKMLPSIYFIFSRRNCDKAVTELHEVTLVTKTEQLRIDNYINSYKINTPEVLRDLYHIDALRRGIAAHHAGLLPPWKELIEKLFQEGLIKVVFATETLAAGINMPARSTVIAALSKRTDIGHRPLESNEFLQMAGRAGRRGLDKLGYVVILQNHSEGILEATQLIYSKANPLISQFVPTYSMVANLMKQNSLDQTKELVERSFGQYLINVNFAKRKTIIEKLKLQLSTLMRENLTDYSQDKKYINFILRQVWNKKTRDSIRMALGFLHEGTLVTIQITSPSDSIVPAVLVRKIHTTGYLPLVLCLTSENIWVLLPYNSIIQVYTEVTYLKLSKIKPPDLNVPGQVKIGDDQTMILALAVAYMVNCPELLTKSLPIHTEGKIQSKLKTIYQQKLKTEFGIRSKQYKNIKKYQREKLKLATEINRQEKELLHQSRSHWDIFLSIIEVLQHFGCLNQFKPTNSGRMISLIRGDNELWLGLVLMSGHLDDLVPTDLVALAESITIDINRPRITCTYSTSATAERTFYDISEIRAALLHAQQEAQISIPISWEPELMGLVQAWSKGVQWKDLSQNTSLDEGDIIKAIRRTIDFLAQIPNCPGISEKLRLNTRLALNAISRFPVSDHEFWAKEQNKLCNEEP